MGSNTKIDKENIIPSYEHLPEDVRLLLEEHKKKRDEEDLQAALASIKIDRCGNITKIKEIDFASASTDASTEDAVLPVEVNLDAYRCAKQNDLNVGEYHDLTMDNIDEITDKRLMALKEIEKDKTMVAKAYNKKVKAKSFQIRELVWKTVLPLKTKDRRFGKWTPSWEAHDLH
ncbi:uncharacterized protein LOC120653239 [Panicum virgatum]|uniref:uncharacterized protein LOC120653239 n=1 Tax=Panicum virgatum TaxID=38727 RepID=UPI0019D66417|nr:uncharacterized protein LOC120653239 [Panicum virgatum]